MTVASDLTVMQLDEIVEELEADDRRAFERVFHVGTSRGDLIPPESMYAWIREHFGDVERIRQQKIIKVTNVVTLEGVLFNWLRSSRPIWREDLDLDAQRLQHPAPHGDRFREQEPRVQSERPYRGVDVDRHV